MLVLPDIAGEPHFRILAIDPGTTTLGIAIVDYNHVDDTYLVEHATTIPIGKLFAECVSLIETQSEKAAKLRTVQTSVLNMLMAWNPSAVVSEGPYMGSFPSAYAALVECVSNIRFAVEQFNPFYKLAVFDPASVKKSVGVSGKSGDKELVRKALARMPNLLWVSDLTLNSLDEHSVDAIAVAIAYTRIPLTL